MTRSIDDKLDELLSNVIDMRSDLRVLTTRFDSHVAEDKHLAAAVLGAGDAPGLKGRVDRLEQAAPAAMVVRIDRLEVAEAERKADTRLVKGATVGSFIAAAIAAVSALLKGQGQGP